MSKTASWGVVGREKSERRMIRARTKNKVLEAVLGRSGRGTSCLEKGYFFG